MLSNHLPALRERLGDHHPLVCESHTWFTDTAETYHISDMGGDPAGLCRKYWETSEGCSPQRTLLDMSDVEGCADCWEILSSTHSAQLLTHNLRAVAILLQHLDKTLKSESVRKRALSGTGVQPERVYEAAVRHGNFARAVTDLLGRSLDKGLKDAFDLFLATSEEEHRQVMAALQSPQYQEKLLVKVAKALDTKAAERVRRHHGPDMLVVWRVDISGLRWMHGGLVANVALAWGALERTDSTIVVVPAEVADWLTWECGRNKNHAQARVRHSTAAPPAEQLEVFAALWKPYEHGDTMSTFQDALEASALV